MRILIATGIYPPDIGGPAQYTKEVEDAWKKEGHTVKVLSFRFERKLPTGIRHLYYFFRALFCSCGTDFVFSPDTFSAALPALCAAKLCGKKIIIRTGGDFLWERYVERTNDLVLLRNFYQQHVFRLNLKEWIIFRLIWFLFRYADAIIFSTAWQRDIFEKPYRFDLKKCFIVENYYSPHGNNHSQILKNMRMEKVFIGGTRQLQWKNVKRLRSAFANAKALCPEIELDLQPAPRGQFLEKIKSAYAVILASLGDISPNTILEAIQCGKPFILTRETGLYEKLKDIGVWVNPEDIDDIATKIEWLTDEKNYEIQCKKVEAFAFTHSWDEICDEILAVYRNLTNTNV